MMPTQDDLINLRTDIEKVATGLDALSDRVHSWIASAEPAPDPPPPVPVPSTGAAFGWTWATPLQPTSWGQPLTPAVTVAAQTTARLHARHIIGWGPDEARSSLRPFLYSQVGGRRLALFGAKCPGIMKASRNAYDESAPLPTSFDAFADFCAAYCAEHKPALFAVWSEMRGGLFWNNDLNNRNVGPYIILANKVAAAVRAASPATAISVPYVPVLSWLKDQGGTYRKGTGSVGTAVASGPGGAWGLLDRRDLDVIDTVVREVDFDVLSFDTGIWTKPEVDSPGLNQLPGVNMLARVDKLLTIGEYCRSVTDKPILCAETYLGTDPNLWKYLLERAPDNSTWCAWGVAGHHPNMTTEFVDWLKARP